MKLRALLLMAVAGVILAGCAHGPIAGKYPPAYTSETPATIVIERPGIMLGSGMNVKASIDGAAAYTMPNDTQLVFKTDPGEHYFGVMGVDGILRPTHHEIPVVCEPGETYYLLIKMHLWIPPTIETVRKLEIRTAAN